MHIPKFVVVFSLAVFCAGSLHAQRADSDLQNKAREQLHEAESKMDSQPATPPPATAAPEATKPPAQPAPAQPQPAAVAAPTPAPAQATPAAGQAKTLTPDQQQQALEALHKTEADLDAKQAAAATGAAKPASVTAPAVAAVPMTQSKPMTGMTNTPAMGSTAAAPEPGSKAARLEELLQLYRSGAIGPAEYQERRTKIRAEPDK